MRKLFNAILRPVYRVYEAWLWRQIKDGPFPKHVAIIPDGNRRWARLSGLDAKKGHEEGYEKLKDVLKWLLELGIPVVTIYAMSYENCLFRPEDERNHLFSLVEKGLKELKDIADKYEVKVRVIGRIDLVPDTIKSAIKEIEERTANYSKHVLNIALCYGGRQEIVDATKRLCEDVKKGELEICDICEETFSKYLYTAGLPDPDLIIRTSGEVRLSGFLLWQAAYSELYFCDAFWPDFRKIDLWRAIRSYQKRERRFGR